MIKKVEKSKIPMLITKDQPKNVVNVVSVNMLNPFYLMSILYYTLIVSKTLPIIRPPNVPKIYPIIAMSTPMGMSAWE